MNIFNSDDYFIFCWCNNLPDNKATRKTYKKGYNKQRIGHFLIKHVNIFNLIYFVGDITKPAIYYLYFAGKKLKTLKMY